MRGLNGKRRLVQDLAGIRHPASTLRSIIRTFMLLEPVHQYTHPIIPQLDAPIVQRCSQ